MRITRGVYQAAMIGILGVAVLGSTLAIARRGGDYAFFDPLIDVKHLLSTRFVDEPDEKAMRLGAINGMVEALNDPYTVYVPPAAEQEFTKGLTGQYVGIGAQVQMRDGWLTIVTPLDGSPAFKAGLMADDRVVEIEGKSTEDLSIMDSVNLLMGEPGTPVNITVERDGRRIPITITRQHIVQQTVKGFERAGDQWRFMLDASRRIAFVRVTQFTPSTAEEFAQRLRELGADSGDLGGLVIDLRGNPGGVLTGAVQMADLFLDQGVIVSTKGRNPDENQVASAHAQGTLPDFPVAILIDGLSASASEIFTGALTENGRAIAVGTRSFGKGSVQSIHPLPSGAGGQLKITEQRYYLPSGRSLHRSDDSTQWGVDPTEGFYVPLSDEETIQMLRVRREQDIIRAGEPDQEDGAPPDTTAQWSDPAWIVDTLKDKQLAAALEAVQKRIDSGQWVPTGQPGIAGDQVVLQQLQRARRTRSRMLLELSRLDSRVARLRAGAGIEQITPPDLWPDDANLLGGRVRVTDKDGHVVATLKITGEDLERWLAGADVEPIEPGAPADGDG